MQIRYRNTLNQLIALQKFMLRNSAFGKKMMVHRFIMVECILVFICAIFAVNHNRLVVLGCFAGLSALAWLLRERAVIMQFRKEFRRERRKSDINLLDRDRILTIDENGFEVRIGSRESRYTWDEVETTGQDKKHIYILLKGVLHHVMPKSAWPDLERAEAFYTTLQNYRLN